MTIFNHAALGASDLAKSATFYDAALAPLGIKNMGSFEDRGVLYGADKPEFLILSPLDGNPASNGNGSTLGFAARNRGEVRAFYEAGLSAGGSGCGEPQDQPVGPNAYGAYLRDPDGNKICAYCYIPE